MAAKLPGRTDNEIKNVWHTRIKKRLKSYQSTRESKRQKIKEPEPQSQNEIVRFGYGSISQQSSSELSSVTYSKVMLTQDIVKHENLNSSKIPDHDLRMWFEPDQESKDVERNDGKDFWYNLLIKAEDLQDLPEF